jgi:hypothetical protein
MRATVMGRIGEKHVQIINQEPTAKKTYSIVRPKTADLTKRTKPFNKEKTSRILSLKNEI